MQGNKLYVGNINYATTVDELEDVFAQYGSIEEIKLIEGKGFGFVTMGSNEEAEEAMKSLDGFELAGRQLRVNEARPQQKNDRPRQSRSGGSRSYGGGSRW